MESDKVAASRAMQQNNKMKQEIEELQKELVNLINSKVTYFGKNMVDVGKTSQKYLLRAIPTPRISIFFFS